MSLCLNVKLPQGLTRWKAVEMLVEAGHTDPLVSIQIPGRLVLWYEGDADVLENLNAVRAAIPGCQIEVSDPDEFE